jgi:hypothetical protein
MLGRPASSGAAPVQLDPVRAERPSSGSPANLLIEAMSGDQEGVEWNSHRPGADPAVGFLGLGASDASLWAF